MAENAWSEIAVPSGPDKEKFRRADKSHPFDFFRGRDYLGRHLFIFRCSESDPGEKLPNPHGIEVIHEPADVGLWQLKLLLSDSNQADIFGALCANLMEATRGLRQGDEPAALSVILKRLMRWQSLLRAGRSPLLPESQQLGLFGELTFLRDVLIPRFDVPASVRSWRGTYGDEQDFSAGAVLIEVKTLRETSDRRVEISSAEQLDDTSGPIVLCVQSACEVSEETEGCSLLSLAADLSSMADAAGPVVGDTFRAALHELGYEPRPEYGIPLRQVLQRHFFRVADSFPRLVASDLRPGVRDLRYRIDVALMEPFQISEQEVWGG